MEERGVKGFYIAVFAVVLGFLISNGYGQDQSPATTQTAQNSTATTKVVLTHDEALIMRLVNEERAERGLKALTFDPLLTTIARQHSSDMAKRRYFSHIEPAPTGFNPRDRYVHVAGKQPECVVGENIAYCDQPQFGMIHKSLMDSPDHKANILDTEYTNIGIGIYERDDGQIWLTQMFCCTCKKKPSTERL